MIYTATRRIQFCAGHRVMEHGSKCRNMHGHNYVAMITAQSSGLNPLGMVVDFSVLKDVVGKWIDDNWDHGFIAYEKDLAVYRGLGQFEAVETEPFRQKLFSLPSNPTAENMAAFLLEKANTLLAEHGVVVTEVVLWETENCYATVRLPQIPSDTVLSVVHEGLRSPQVLAR